MPLDFLDGRSDDIEDKKKKKIRLAEDEQRGVREYIRNISKYSH